MNIEVRSVNLSVSEALREHVERRVAFALGRFASVVERVIVRMVDVNGPKGGPDKRCRIIARLTPSGSVIVEAMDADIYAAASQAAIRLDERVSRALTKRRPRPSTARRPSPRRRRAASSERPEAS